MKGASAYGGTGREITVVIDGREHGAEEGRNMLDVALSLGFDLPYFCWHPHLGSIGACRQCAVRQHWVGRDGREQSEIVMACMTEAADGVRIDIDDDEARRFRARMIELMMMSHPHDCPVCDEGGECHLQDMTVMTGHVRRRYRGDKRTWANQDLGPFVTHEMNRCISCYRCTRFYNDYAGGRDFGVFGIRDRLYFGRDRDGTLESPFSGNLVEVCPTGVFDDKTLLPRYTRKWDLQSAPSVCPHCSLGCGVWPGARAGELRRMRARYNESVNGDWLCDRGRYGYEFVNSPLRLRRPLLRRAEGRVVPGKAPARDLLPAATGDALAHVAARLRRGPAIGIGSPRLSLEANYALRTLVGAERFFSGMSAQDERLVGLQLEIMRDGACRTASLRDVGDADAVVVLGEDLADTAPMVELAIRTWYRLRPTAGEVRNHIRRWNDAGIGRFKRVEPSLLIVAGTRPGALDELAREAWQAPPDELARVAFAAAHELGGPGGAAPRVRGLSPALRRRAASLVELLRGAERPLIVAGASAGSEALLKAAATLAWSLPGGADVPRLLLTAPAANSVGLGLLGGRPLTEAAAALRAGEADCAIVLDDLFRSLPVEDARELIAACPHLISVATFRDRTASRAEAVLPAATWAESTGTFVNNEGRAQRFYAVLPAPGEARDAWRWLLDLLSWLERPEGERWQAVDDAARDLAAELPQFAGVDEAAPPAGYRVAGARVARQPFGWSGRTALHADADVYERPIPGDPDSPLAFTLEGARGPEVPGALLPNAWAPGWNSVNSLHRFQQEVGGPLRGGPAGRRLIEAGGRRAAYGDVPPAFEPPPGRLQLLPIHHLFGSERLSLMTPGIAERAPAPYVALRPEDAAALRAREGRWLVVRTDTARRVLPLRVMADLPPGCAGLPVGLPGLDGMPVPAWATITVRRRGRRR